MNCVYVAGAYSANNVIDVLSNMRRGMRASTEVLLAGFSPFSPWLDYQFSLMLQNDETLSVEDYYKYSMSWLERSDCVLVLPNSEHSKGTQAEIRRAQELGIPIYYRLKDIPKSPAEEKERSCPSCGAKHIHSLTTAGGAPLYCG